MVTSTRSGRSEILTWKEKGDFPGAVVERNALRQTSTAASPISSCASRDKPARRAACADTAAAPVAMRRKSFATVQVIWPGLSLIGFSDAYVAGLPAIRTVVEAIDAQPDVIGRLAKAAVSIASALRLRFVAQ